MLSIDVLVFAKPEAAVCQFSATIDGYEFQGEVQETVDAETECDGTIRTGKRAFMLQAKGLPDIGMVYRRT